MSKWPGRQFPIRSPGTNFQRLSNAPTSLDRYATLVRWTKLLLLSAIASPAWSPPDREPVNTLKANDTIEIEVEDDFAISALRIVMMQGDTGSDSSITQHIFRTSFLDAQVFGCVYKDIFYQFEGGFFEGFESEYHWFEKNGRKWSTV